MRPQRLLDSRCARYACRHPAACHCARDLDLHTAFRFFFPTSSGQQGDIFGEVVGTPEPAWPARDQPRSTSPTDLQSHSGAAPGLPTLADPPNQPHHHVNHFEAWIGTQVNASEPLHIPPFEDLEHQEHLRIASIIFGGHENYEYPPSAGYDF